ncbi:DUF721 domain-containing protein [Pseudoglutamicibacter albus]|uniref:Nucleic acid-binding Zn ribbon protein n=1 Tax=Pseudoglutamicibacter albus TaxID=98671 RepID=A0ABU1Z1Q2_9MICC|nr:DciA family protein [Pseudoglutamicibacter albus]MDR7294551.1 putative nucleic acid-binding Zn ribbon protein [Pseudoglutamicibacter albus]
MTPQTPEPRPEEDSFETQGGDFETQGCDAQPNEVEVFEAELEGLDALVDDAPAVVLARARKLALSQGDVRRDAAMVQRAKQKARARKSRKQKWDDPDAGGRDPVGLGELLERMMRSRGWAEPVAVGSVLARWPEIVGPQVAAHAVAESFEDSVVVVRCSSTAWATNLQLMQHDLLKRLDAAVGHGVVTRIKALGPAAPSWRKGPRSAPGGRGPRDTYG